VHANKAYRELEEYVHSFLTSALYEGELPASRLGCFTQGRSLKFTLNRRGRRLCSQWSILGENNNYCAYLERENKIKRSLTVSEYRLSQRGSSCFCITSCRGVRGTAWLWEQKMQWSRHAV